MCAALSARSLPIRSLRIDVLVEKALSFVRGSLSCQLQILLKMAWLGHVTDTCDFVLANAAIHASCVAHCVQPCSTDRGHRDLTAHMAVRVGALQARYARPRLSGSLRM